MDKRDKAIEYLTKLRDCNLANLQNAFLGRDCGLTFVISYMSYAKDPVTAKHLSETMNVSMARVTALIQKLEERELIYRKPSKEDGRVSLLYLTDKGHEEANKIIETSIVIAEKVIEKIGLEKIDDFLDTVFNIREIINENFGGDLC